MKKNEGDENNEGGAKRMNPNVFHFSFFALHFSLFTLHFSLLTSCQSESEVKRDQYVAEGFGLYQTHCSNCHQRDGKGLENLYPALSPEYLVDKSNVICWIKYGVNQPMNVSGKVYHRAMPANPALKDLEIAEIVTYVYNTWGKETNITTTEMVQGAVEKCSSN